MYTMTHGGNYAPTTPERSVGLNGTRKHKRKFRAVRGMSTVRTYDHGMMRSVCRAVISRTETRK